MQQNYLADIKFLYEEIIVGGSADSGSTAPTPYQRETKEIFQKVLNYIKSCSWSNVETVKFITQYFIMGQSNMADAWSRMKPNRPSKAESTFRSQWQSINQYLNAVFPSNMIEIFTSEDIKKMKEISSTIDALLVSNRGIERDLGEQLIGELQKLPLPSKRYSVADCSYEIKVLKRLSLQSYQVLLATCDKEKLSYLFAVLLESGSTKGTVNKERLGMIHAYTKANEKIPQKQIVKNSIAEYTDKTVDVKPNKMNSQLLPHAQEQIEALIKGVEPSEKVSPIAVQVVSDYIAETCARRLSALKPEDLSCVYQQLLSDDKDTTTDRLIQIFCNKDMIGYEMERLSIKREKAKA